MISSAISSCALAAQLIEAGFGHVLRIGLQLGGGGGELAAPVAGCVEQLARA